jgi:hypothetical protein
MPLLSSRFPRRWRNRAGTDHKINTIGGLALDLVDLRIPDESAVALLREHASPGTCRSAARLLSLDGSGVKRKEIGAACRLLEMASNPREAVAVNAFIVDHSNEPVSKVTERISLREVRFEGIDERVNRAF